MWRWGERFLFAGSVLLWMFVSACYLFRPIECAAITVFPVWLWMIPGGLMVGVLWLLRCKARTLAVLWLVFLVAFAEEPRSLLRVLLPTPRSDARGRMRIVSLNCAGGLLEAAREVVGFRLDIVLFQGSPSENEVRRLAHELFGDGGGWAHGPDGSIIARGRVNPYTMGREDRIFCTPRTYHPLGWEANRGYQPAVIASIDASRPLVACLLARTCLRPAVSNGAVTKGGAENRLFARGCRYHRGGRFQHASRGRAVSVIT